MQHRRLIIILISSATILLIPLITMQFTEEVNWSMLDFMVAGVLVLGAGLMFDLVIRKVKNIKHRAVVHASASNSLSAYLGRTCSWHFRNATRRTINPPE